MNVKKIHKDIVLFHSLGLPLIYNDTRITNKTYHNLLLDFYFQH